MCPESSAHTDKRKSPNRITTVCFLSIEDYDFEVLILKDQTDT